MSVTTLKRLVGIQFEFKRELQNYFYDTLDNDLVLEYDVVDNNPGSRLDLANKFALCGPAMGFEAKKFAYGTLELVVNALVNNPDVPDSYIEKLNDQLVNITRYVGIAGEEDFHFMVAVYNLCATISDIFANVVPLGAIGGLSLGEGGEGYTVDGLDANETGVVFRAYLSIEDQIDPIQYVEASVEGTITSGAVSAITDILSPGEGFADGSVVSLEIDTTVSGQEDATGSGATATVSSLA